MGYRFLSLIFLVQFFVSLNSYAGIVTSVQDGDWEDPSTWLAGTIPQDGDEIIINVEDTVFIQSEIRFFGSGMIVNDAGTLNMVNGKLHLPSNSTFNIQAGGKLLWTINGTGCNNNLKIGPSIMWKGCWGNITTPTVFGTPLPVELISFTGIYNNGILLKWATASEINSDYFLIESSFDGITWNTIATVSGSGNSETVVNYSYYDERVVSGAVYYRLTQYDYDGVYEIFKTIVVQSETDVKLIQNPVTNYAKINIDSDNIDWSLIDLSGNIIKSGTSDVINSRVDINIADINSGLYILNIVSEASQTTVRLLKN